MREAESALKAGIYPWVRSLRSCVLVNVSPLRRSNSMEMAGGGMWGGRVLCEQQRRRHAKQNDAQVDWITWWMVAKEEPFQAHCVCRKARNEIFTTRDFANAVEVRC